MNIEKKPFINYTLDEDKKQSKSEVISLRLNQDEREIINQTKELFNIKNDSKAIKVLVKWAFNVIHGQSMADIIKYLFKKDRVKQNDFEQLGMAEESDL